ncbi:MAG: MBL fold metallo-hydrolase [Solirubrobacteraceae bacterium]
MFQRDVAPGIHRIEHNHTNFYLVEDGDRVTIVDACIPPAWGSLPKALAEIGRTLGDVDALILTHAHFDHIGFAERARRELGVDVWVHEADEPLTKHPRTYRRERPLLQYVLTQPRAFPVLAGFITSRGMWPPAVEQVRTFTERQDLPVTGAPKTVFTPGHTDGHCAFHYPDRDAVIAGDCVVVYDPYLAKACGPKVVSRAATADSAQALSTLDALAATGAKTVLTGHGDPWTQGAEAAVEHARAVGVT